MGGLGGNAPQPAANLVIGKRQLYDIKPAGSLPNFKLIPNSNYRSLYGHFRYFWGHFSSKVIKVRIVMMVSLKIPIGI